MVKEPPASISEMFKEPDISCLNSVKLEEVSAVHFLYHKVTCESEDRMDVIPDSRKLCRVRQSMDIVVTVGVAEVSLVFAKIDKGFVAELRISDLLGITFPRPFEEDERNRGGGLLVMGKIKGTTNTNVDTFDRSGDRSGEICGDRV